MSDSDELMVEGVDVGHSAPIGGSVDVAPEASDAEEEDIEIMVPDESECARIRPKRQRSRPPLVTTGRFWTLVVHASGGEGTEKVHAVAEVSWRLERQGGGVCGCIEYLAEQVFFLATPANAPHDRSSLSSPLYKVAAMNACGDRPLEIRSASSSSSVPTTVRACVSAQGGSIQAVMWVSSTELDKLRDAPSGSSCRFRTVPVHNRAVGAGVVESLPDLKVLKRWRTQCKGEGGDRSTPVVSTPPGRPNVESVLPCLFLPAGVTPETLSSDHRRKQTANVSARPDIDPIQLVYALSFASHLRSPKYFTEALDDAEAYLGRDDDNPTVRDRSTDPRHSTMQRALAKSDAVACLLHRRFFKAWFEADCIKCICVYSDASPVVGTEIQGMVIDVIFHDGATERIILPGSTLAYCLADTVAKGIALLWAIFLVAGPSAQALRAFCWHVSSFTTDFGVEMHLLEMPDVIDAFVAWVSGAPLERLRPLVNQDTRLFQRALRMAGWSHTLGGIMKEVANSMDEWPHVLKQMRSLVRNFRNGTYRRHIYMKLKDTGPADLHQLMSKSPASFAKWRYETVPAVQSQLLPLRVLCEMHLDFVLFAHAQDKNEIREWMHACRDKEFWEWAAATYPHLFAPLEETRRWGVICDCPDHVAERKRTGGRKFIKCHRTNQFLKC